MRIRRDAVAEGPEGLGPIERLARLALLAYLSPALLVVLAIGLAGMLAAKIGKPAPRVVVGGAHPGHKPARPLGLARTPAQAREMA